MDISWLVSATSRLKKGATDKMDGIDMGTPLIEIKHLKKYFRTQRGKKQHKGGRTMKVSDFVEGKLMEIGATPEYTGYKYLVCAIVMSMQNEYLLNNVTTKMYPAIGKRYGVSPASIERSIRTVISAIWYDGDPELLRKLMGRSYPVQPGNAKFIGVVSRRLSFYCRRNAETSKISGQANI